MEKPKQYEHQCIKPTCSTTYKDTDPDAYYCSPCNEFKVKIAKEVDAKLLKRPKKPYKSALQEYDEAPKVHGFVQVK